MRKNRGLILFVVVIFAAAVLFSGCGLITEMVRDAFEEAVEEPQATPTALKPEAPDELPELPNDGNLAPLIPLSVLMDSVEYTPPSINSDGSRIMYRHMSDFSDDIVVEEWQTGETTEVVWPYEAAGIPYYYWAPDGETVLFFVDGMGDENFGLYISNVETGDTQTILPAGVNDCYYVSDNPQNDKEIYIQLFDYGRQVFDLYLINYETGAKRLVLKNPGDITYPVFDHEGVLRAVNRIDDEAGNHVWVKKNPGKKNTTFVEREWEEILSWDYEDSKLSRVFGFMQDNTRLMYLDTSETDTSSLITYDLDTGEKTLVFNDPDYEINGTWTDIEMDKVVALTVYSQMIEWKILDESFRDDYDALAKLEDGVFDIIGSSEQDEYWVVAYVSDVGETDYYMYDMATQETTFLFNGREELSGYEFSPAEPIAFTASDGLEIEGYAHFPAGAEKKDLPMVVLVHGGPWSRDTWEFYPEAQMLANRGYLVLRINFRGSSGYGKEFLLAGDKEWGRAMHQDILDGVDYAVQQGWADQQRVGVYGASYGGYEALICAAFSSDVFQCAVDAFGPSSLLTFVESIPPQWQIQYNDLIRSIGDPETEADLMRERSPLYYVDDIEIPLLIAQGENDIRVVQSESDQMVDALEKAGVPVKYLLFEDTGHGFSSMETRMQFYSEMESFFAEHLGGRAE